MDRRKKYPYKRRLAKKIQSFCKQNQNSKVRPRICAIYPYSVQSCQWSVERLGNIVRLLSIATPESLLVAGDVLLNISHEPYYNQMSSVGFRSWNLLDQCLQLNSLLSNSSMVATVQCSVGTYEDELKSNSTTKNMNMME